jgi:hypothetical protein
MLAREASEQGPRQSEEYGEGLRAQHPVASGVRRSARLGFARAKAAAVQVPSAVSLSCGGVPERSKGAVLKTVGRRKVPRGFESHPRR